MCAVSNVGDDWSRKLPGIWPEQLPSPSMPGRIVINKPEVSREEFLQLKTLVEHMREELVAARKQDEADGEPDCEMEDKVKLLKAVAAAVGVDISRAFPND